MRKRHGKFRHFSKKVGRFFANLTLKTERTARISLLLCTTIVAGSCISVSALSIQSRENTIVADSIENVDAESIMVTTYQEFMDITSAENIDSSELSEDELKHVLVDGIKMRREYTGTPYEEEDDEEVSAEVIQNTAPKDLSDRQITRMLTGNTGTVRVIQRSDINEGAANSGSSTDTGNANATVSNSSSVTKNFDENNNYVIGIDVSGWNGTINWSKVKGYGVEFVIVKCGGRYTGSGLIYQDSKFATNVKGAAAAGIKVGVYFYSAATSIQEAYEEASFTVDVIRNYNITYPVAIDFEKNSTSERHYNIKGKDLRDILCTFCDTVASQGYSPMVYMSKSLWTNSNGLGSYGSEVASKYRVWLAAYFNRFISGTTPFKIGDKLPSFSFRYHIWQYGYLHGVIPGITGDVDMNLGFFSSQTLLDPAVTVNGGYLYTTAGTVISAMQGVTCMNSLGQDVNPSYVTTTVKNSSGKEVTMAAACATPGVYTISYSFGDAYRGTVTESLRLLVANPVDGSIPGCSPTPVPETSPSESSSESSSDSSSASSSESSSSESSSESSASESTSESTTEATTESTTAPTTVPVVDDTVATE